MPEARTPEEETIEPDDESGDSSTDDVYRGPDPREDPKGDAADEDQGT
jgi:hypothetical protein